jgi:hypothetical protein
LRTRICICANRLRRVGGRCSVVVDIDYTIQRLRRCKGHGVHRLSRRAARRLLQKSRRLLLPLPDSLRLLLMIRDDLRILLLLLDDLWLLLLLLDGLRLYLEWHHQVGMIRVVRTERPMRGLRRPKASRRGLKLLLHWIIAGRVVPRLARRKQTKSSQNVAMKGTLGTFVKEDIGRTALKEFAEKSFELNGILAVLGKLVDWNVGGTAGTHSLRCLHRIV